MEITMKIHHIGIVVNNVEEAVNRHNKLFGQENNIIYEVVPSQRVRIALIGEKPGEYIEYIEPLNENSPVYSLYRRGGGLHHICYYTNNLSTVDMQLSSFYRRITTPTVGLLGNLVA